MIKEPYPAGLKGGERKKILVIGIILLFIAGSISISNEAGEERIKNEDDEGKIIYQQMETGIKADYATDRANVSIDSTTFSTIIDGQVFHIYEGLPWRLYITAYWDPPQGEPICIWVDPATLPEGARIIPEDCTCGIDSVTITLEWTPAIGQAGTYVIRFYVGYECYVPISFFNITVIVDPYIPIPTESFVICAEEEFILNVTAYWEPPQPEKLICLWIYEPSLPEGATFDECHCDYGSVTSTFRWTPSSDQVGEYIVTFLAGEYCGYYTFPFSIEIIVEICEDNIPPTTTKIIEGPQYGDYVTSETMFTLVAEDEGGSGVNRTFYRIWYCGNWTDWMNYTGSFTLQGEGPHYIEFYSVDKAGNIEEVHNNTHIVDDTPPRTEPNKNPKENWRVPNKWALICAGTDKDETLIDKNKNKHKVRGDWFLADALFAYYTLRDKFHYKEDHIILLLPIDHHKNKPVYRDDKKTNLLYGPDGKKNTKDDPPNNIPAPSRHNLMKAFMVLSKKVKKEDEVLIYLVNHGSIDGVTEDKKCDQTKKHYTYFCSGNSWVREDVFAEWIQTLRMKCKKVVVICGFCYSSCFLDLVKSDPKDVESGITITKPGMGELILISSAGRNCKNHSCNCSTAWGYPCKEVPKPPFKEPSYAGGDFDHRFWNLLKDKESYKAAFDDTIKTKPPGEKKALKDLQDPRMKMIGVKSPEKNSPSQPESTKPGGSISFSPVDEGGTTYVNVELTYNPDNGTIGWISGEEMGNPVGVKATYYRIWHNGEWTPWQEFTENITFEEEGKYYVEWYSEDYLGNKEDVINHTIYVDVSPPDITPNPSYPPDGGETDNVPTFNWSASEDPSDVSYTLQIATDESFVNIVFEEDNVSRPTYTLTSEEELDRGTYYWHVRATDGLGHTGNWSVARSFTVVKENSPPDKPTRPTGRIWGEVGTECNISTTISDADGDEMLVWFNWGDGTHDLAFGYYKSGDTVTMSHSWEEKGVYSVRVKAADMHGYESEWSDPLPIVVPYSFNVSIEYPRNGLYVFGKKLLPLKHTIIIGPLKIGASGNGLDKAEFYIDGKLKYVAYEAPFTWIWNEFAFGRHEIKVIVYDYAGNIAIDEQKIWILNI
ncbi:MAG: hypothetical protein J7K95_02060 [Thermoplasmata archaeon]|nr:hypothetical protein [Thermoplasmata archaeon]